MKLLALRALTLFTVYLLERLVTLSYCLLRRTCCSDLFAENDVDDGIQVAHVNCAVAIKVGITEVLRLLTDYHVDYQIYIAHVNHPVITHIADVFHFKDIIKILPLLSLAILFHTTFFHIQLTSGFWDIVKYIPA